MSIKHRATCFGLGIGAVLAALFMPTPTRSQFAIRPNSTQLVASQRIREVLDTQVAAWNKGDLKSFMAGYWKSDNLSFFSGKDKTRGWQATLERYQKRYQAEGREMGKLTFDGLEIETLGPDAAWVRGQWQVVTSKETLGGLFTLIFKKFPEGWRIVHDHTSG